MRWSCALAVALLLALPPTRAGEMPADIVVDIERPPGRMIDLGGYRLHLYCRGRGQPVVVFDAGLGGFSMDWIFVQALLDPETTVCAWDRAGYGWSESGPAPRDSDQIAGELGALLRKAGIPPPYVLVGHSFGGYNVEVFARMNPRAVAGIVLVESSHPDQAERLPHPPVEPERQGRGRIVTFFDPNVVYRHYPEKYWFPMGGLMTSAKALHARQRELGYFEVSAAQVRMAGELPPVPLVVVTRGLRVWPETPLGDALEKTWAELQQELALSVPGGRQIIARNSGHLVHLDEPEMVVHAVRLVLRDHCGGVRPEPAGGTVRNC